MHKQGSALIAIGLLLIAAALSLTAYNIWDGQRAEVAASETVEVLWNAIPGYAEQHPEVMAASAGGRQSGLNLYQLLNPLLSLFQSQPAQNPEIVPDVTEEPELFLEEPTIPGLPEELPEEGDQPQLWVYGETLPAAIEETEEIPLRKAHGLLYGSSSLLMWDEFDYRSIFDLIPDREMPSVLVGGNRYIGVLDVPSMELSLPVMDEWDYDKLKVAPCLYSGSAYQNTMVICAHNYPTHFSPLKYAPIDTPIIFTDVDGIVYRYIVTSVETVDPNALEQMVEGDWDLTLFTCNSGGQTRCAVRCDRIN